MSLTMTLMIQTKEERLRRDTVNVALGISCTCCGQIYDKDTKQVKVDERIEDFRANGYATCPRCLKSVTKEKSEDPHFRKNVDRFIKARIAYLKHYVPKPRRSECT